MSSVVALWEPKLGTARSEWEDGCAYSPATGWFAVADGASAGTSSREWAYTLVATFVGDKRDELLRADAGWQDRFLGWLGGVRDGFSPEAQGFTRSEVPQWVRDAGRRRGAFSTFLGGRVSASGWSAVAIGDCCLFRVRAGGSAVESFPETSAGDFGATPDLIPSVRGDDDALAAALRRGDGPLDRGDVVLAGTDAIAEWLVRAGLREAWDLLLRVDDVGFREVCDDLRARREMRDDDITLLRFPPAGGRGGDG